MIAEETVVTASSKPKHPPHSKPRLSSMGIMHWFSSCHSSTPCLTTCVTKLVMTLCLVFGAMGTMILLSSPYNKVRLHPRDVNGGSHFLAAADGGSSTDETRGQSEVVEQLEVEGSSRGGRTDGEPLAVYPLPLVSATRSSSSGWDLSTVENTAGERGGDEVLPKPSAEAVPAHIIAIDPPTSPPSLSPTSPPSLSPTSPPSLSPTSPPSLSPTSPPSLSPSLAHSSSSIDLPAQEQRPSEAPVLRGLNKELKNYIKNLPQAYMQAAYPMGPNPYNVPGFEYGIYYGYPDRRSYYGNYEQMGLPLPPANYPFAILPPMHT